MGYACYADRGAPVGVCRRGRRDRGAAVPSSPCARAVCKRACVCACVRACASSHVVSRECRSGTEVSCRSGTCDVNPEVLRDLHQSTCELRVPMRSADRPRPEPAAVDSTTERLWWYDQEFPRRYSRAASSHQPRPSAQSPLTSLSPGRQHLQCPKDRRGVIARGWDSSAYSR